MKNNKINKYIRWGLLINIITMTANRFIDINEIKIIYCFLMGISISLLSFGIITMKHDMTRMRELKKVLIKRIIKG